MEPHYFSSEVLWPNPKGKGIRRTTHWELKPMGLPLLHQYSMKRVKPNPEATYYISAIQENKSRFEFQHPLDPFYGQALCQVLKEER